MNKDSLQESIDWLYSTQFFGIKLGLDNISKLLTEYLAYPSYETKVIQVAGTNGKGSTSAFIESVARAHGITTGLFTSPHLVEFGERIRICGENIADHTLQALIDELRELVKDWDSHPTFFELSLALAMKHFKREKCELIILETGMGGRLDATTAVPKDAAVLTPIGLDHQQYLGETLAQITQEKGAIMCTGKPCITSPQHPSAIRELEIIANQKRCDLHVISQPEYGYPLGLKGEHQKWNAALALEALHQVYGNLRYDAVAQGLKTVTWPARFQVQQDQENRQTIVDCCHNVPAVEAFVKQWKESFGERKAHLIFGAAKDKNIEGVLRTLLPIIESVEVYEIDSPRAESNTELSQKISQISPKTKCQPLEHLTQAKTAPLRIVTGSLFLAGEWLRLTATAP